MAADGLRSSKRKSTAATEQTSKKVKVAKPATPAHLKSALKKTKQPATTAESGSKKSKLPATIAETKSKKSKASATTAEPKQRKSRKNDTPAQLADEDDDEQDTTLTPDQTAALLAGFSSSDEDEEEEQDGLAIDKLPKPPKANDNLESVAISTTTDAKVDDETTPGIVYIGRLPHGFYERQMRAYFSQFGTITHLKMGRNKKTGRSKHYAFIEFASASVADIVTKTMDKYLLFNHILRVQRIPTEHVKEGMWKGEGKRKRPMPMNKIEGAKLRKGTDANGWKKRIDRENTRRKSKAKKLEELGYSFEMPDVKGLASLPALDTPTLERGAEKQLLEDVQHAADEQSNDVALQPENVEEPAEEKQSKKKTASASTESAKGKSKKRSTPAVAEKSEVKRPKRIR